MNEHRSGPATIACFTITAAAALAFVGVGTVAAQPLDQRTPNVEGTWIAPPHDLHFQFSHRFQITGADVDVSDLFADGKVVNYPTFALNYGVLPRTMLGVRYSSNSLIASRANEWQPYLKVAPLGTPDQGWSFSLLGAWNAANESLDGELATQLDAGRLTLIGAVRGFSSPFDRDPELDTSELAVAGGLKLRLNEYVALAGDYANTVTQSDAQIGWSAGVSMAIPYSPHTLALFATNVTSGTLEGSSVGVDGTTFWGFEFTIRFSGHRWGELFDPRDEASGAPGPTPADRRKAAGSVVELEIEGMAFDGAELTVPAGSTVRWVNRDPVAHTTTSDDGIWESPLLTSGESFEHTFREPGRYPYHCAPHPFMKGVVVVE